MDVQGHWTSVYNEKEAASVSWYKNIPTRSLSLIQEVSPDRRARIIDVGAGASTLVDNLLLRGYLDVTVLDIAASALDVAKNRVGIQCDAVGWVVADLLEYAPEKAFDLWHDRAVLHFLQEPEQQRQYAEVLNRCVTAHGHAIIATFGVGGPTRCSGLEVVQYDGPRITQLVPSFDIVREETEVHQTPSGSDQRFSYFLLQKRS